MRNKCPSSGNVSFPIRTTIKDFTPFINNLLKINPQLSITAIERQRNPSFQDSRRFSGIIDEPSGSATLIYNSNEYRFSNVQLCLATHTNWIPKKNPTDLIQNKIDIIMVFEIETPIDTAARFVFIVIPLIIDPTTKEDNIYLQGLAYDIADVSFKVDYLLSGLTKFMYYTTCLEPSADNAFVYVSIEGILLSQTLYQDLLAVWRNIGQSDIQTSIKNALIQTTNTQEYLVKIRSAKDLHANNRVINNYSKSLNPLIDNTYENWPAFVPPYDIKINLTNRYITDTMLNLTNEGFQTYTTPQGDELVNVTLNGSIQNVSLQRTVNNVASPSIQLNPLRDGSLQEVKLQTNKMQCVPLDADNAIDASGAITFNADGTIKLDAVANARSKLLDDVIGIKWDKNFEQNIAYAAGVVCGFCLLVGLILFIKKAFPTSNIPIPKYAFDLGFYLIITAIFTFIGVLVGAAVATR